MRRLLAILLAVCGLVGAAEAPRPLPVGVAHGLAAFHWLDPVVLGALLPAPGVNVGKAYTWTGAHTFTASPTSATFTGVPTGVTATTSTLVVNPASASANADLIWAGLNGTAKFHVDEDGDINAAGTLNLAGNYLNIENGIIQLIATGGFAGYVTTQASGWRARGNTIGADRVTMGGGASAQRTLTAHLDQDDVLIKRDVDGNTGTYNEAGALLHLHRDITNAGAEAGNFLECSTDGATPLLSIDKTGGISARASNFGDGGTTNYAAFAADGTLTLAGTARVTKCITFSNLDLSQGGTKPDQTILGNYIGFSYDIGDDSVFTFILPDDWATGTAITVKLRYYINEAYGTANGELRFDFDWTAVPANATEAVDGASTTVLGADQNIPGTAKFLQEYSVGSIAGGSLAAGDEIGISLSRIGLVGGANPTADPVITCVGVTYTADKLGE